MSTIQITDEYGIIRCSVNGDVVGEVIYDASHSEEVKDSLIMMLGEMATDHIVSKRKQYREEQCIKQLFGGV